jgi:hypothetical protein
MQVTGSINGTFLTSAFLQALTVAMGYPITTIQVIDANTITYTITGTSKGNVISNGNIVASTTPPTSIGARAASPR